jgi:hypothetical protein
MLSAGAWRKNQPNTILFVLTNNIGIEVPGLGSSFVLEVCKGAGAFQASAGVKSELTGGWYKYVSTPEESDTSGPVAIRVNGAGIVQQNLEYIVDDRVVTAIEFTYTVTSTAGNVPIPDVKISVYADALSTNIVWTGTTDVFGVARDIYGNKPRLQPGTYYFIRDKNGFIFENPDTEVVS